MAILLLLSVASLASAGDGEHRAGRYTLTLTERDPRSSIDELQKRFGWTELRNARGTYEYDPGDESFEVVVPEGYREGVAHGVVVWIDPGPKGAPPEEWLKALASRRLIWIGANNSGNNRQPVVQRLMLAIDAAHTVAERYTIDPRRIYVAGVSGGGRMSSQVAMAFPDVFTGAMPIVGVDYIRRIVVPDTEYQYRTFKRPPAELFRKALTESRWVLVTGENDYNKPQTQVVHRAMIADRFAHAYYLEQPGMGHGYPNAESFAKGLALLDEPLVTEARKAFADGETFEQLGRFGAAVEAYETAGYATGLDGVGIAGLRKAVELRRLLAESIAVIDDKIDAGQTAGLLAQIQKLKRDWSPLADADADRLVQKMRGR